MYLFQSCNSGWQTELFEEGLYTFEVRAIDRHGRVDATPASHMFDGTDLNPPDTLIVEKPPLLTTSRAATFTFSGVDNGTPAPFLEYECRLDSRDPELWLECFNPTMFSNLTTGEHLLEVRALDGAEQFDPTPARYTVDGRRARELRPGEHHRHADGGRLGRRGQPDRELPVRDRARGALRGDRRSGGPAAGAARRPERAHADPLPGADGRAGLRAGVRDDAPVRGRPDRGPHARGSPAGRAVPREPLTWTNQPAALNAPAATTNSGDGYREWDVKAHVEAMIESGVNYGWQIRDAHETDPEGGDQSFASRETPQDPPEITIPELKLRYEAHTAPPPAAPEMPAGTQPTDVSCGQVLTESTIVGNDLNNCPGEGLVIGASNIVVDLNGHTIDGPNYLLENASGQEEGFPAGIRISDRTNVIVRNGTVQEFGWGALLTSGTTHSVVDNLEIYRNAVAGVEFFDADDGRSGNTVRDSRIGDNELGVLLGAGTENAVVEDNEILGNLGEQVLIHLSDGNRVEGNTMHGIPSDPLLDSDGGVLLEGSSDNDLIDNTVHDTGDAGVMMHMGSHRNTVQGGSYFRNGDAGVIINDSDRNKVIGITSHEQSDGGVVLNHAHDTEVRGSDLRFNPSGVEAGSTNNLLVQNNNASDSLQIGLELGEGVNMRILDNTVERAGGGGISLEGATFDALGNAIGGALITGNTLIQNDGDGLNVADGAHRVGNNTAHNNFGWGIVIGENPEIAGEPFPPSTNVDLGGNVASGNEIVEQCSGLICGAGDAPPIAPPDVTPPTAVIDEAPADGTGSTSATFAFHGEDETTDGAPFSPPTAIAFECRLDPGPDPLPEPVEPDLEPPNPGEPPDIDNPPDGEGWVECTSPVTFHDLEEGEHLFQVRAIDFADLTQYPPTEYEWAIEPRPEDPEAPETIEPETRISSGPPAGTMDTLGDVPLHRQRQLDPGRQPAVRVPVRPARPRRRRLGELRLAAGLHRPGRRHLQLRGPRDRPVRQRRLDAGRADVDGPRPAARHDPARDDDRIRARPDHRADERDVHVLERRSGRHVRVQARHRRGLRRLHVAARADRRDRRQPRAGGARHGRGRQRRPDPGELRLDRQRRSGAHVRALRHEGHAEHPGAERPRRLPVRRPGRRRPRDHDRPQRPHARRQGPRRRRAQQRLRQRHDQERPHGRLGLGRRAQHRHPPQRRRERPARA